jgi:hypothetical protein
MKALCATAAVGLSLLGSMSPALAQYGGPFYREGARDYDYRGRAPSGRDYGDRERGPRFRDQGYGFDERAYLRCNPDVRAAVYRGQFQSGLHHYQAHGQRENRRFRC